ncbi:ABC transporter ATP-binding protein/permease [Sphingomonas sp. KRR8]|uniref:ABC transporter ATP-binding protein n=1 Tax=Sphingomonas sp. KRR8 TaxID=2942996 RepID=UPI00202092B3|nr:ABC transporter ATP-binding protein [Sphingomonas sp. KRR8]URD61580.1 ABC transporter ATP-binding protein/permease [Sphingomonas sp. KRR8]
MSAKQDLGLIWQHLPGSRKLQVGGNAILVIVGAVAEAAMVGALLPLLAFFTDAQQLARIPVIGPWLLEIMERQGQGAVVALFCLAFLVAGAVRLWLTYAIQATAFGVIKDINVSAFARMVRQPYPFYNRTHSADLISRFEKTHNLAYSVVLSGLQAVAAVVLSIALMVLLVAVNARMALIGGGSLIIAYLLVSLVVRRPLRRNATALANVWGRRVQVVQESLGGIRDVLLDQSQRAFEARMEDAADQTRKAMILNSTINFAPRVVVETVLMLFVAAFGFYLSRQPGGITGSLPSLGVMALGALRLLPQVQTAFQGWSAFLGNQKTLEDVTDLLRLPLPMAEQSTARGHFSRELALAGVSFAYDRRPTLADINLTIGKGERVGIVGPTGSGKSTLMDLLLGLLEPNKGDLLIDGEPVRGARRPWWQAQVAHVPQSIFLLDGTIRQNVAFGLDNHEIDDRLVGEALTAAGLASLVAELPDGVETMVGERGARLSGGQRQRLGIARALYKKASVLVFDEATSALDSETEAAVMQAIEQLPGDITIIMIAHRLGTLAGCDRIVVLEKGRIARIVGSVAELT